MVQEAVPVTKRFGTRDPDVKPARVPSPTSIEGSATASIGSTPSRDDSTKQPVIPEEASSEMAASMRGRFVMPGSRRERVVMPASLRERVIEQIEPSVAATVSRDVLRRQIEEIIHAIADKERLELSGPSSFS